MLEKSAQQLRTNASQVCADSHFRSAGVCRMLREFAAAVSVDSGGCYVWSQLYFKRPVGKILARLSFLLRRLSSQTCSVSFLKKLVASAEREILQRSVSPGVCQQVLRPFLVGPSLTLTCFVPSSVKGRASPTEVSFVSMPSEPEFAEKQEMLRREWQALQGGAEAAIRPHLEAGEIF